MKHSTTLQALRRGGRRSPRNGGRNPYRKTLHQEMMEGALFGVFASIVLTFLLSAGPVTAIALYFFSGLGFAAGGVIGIILWIGSARLPEDTVVAPAPGEGRGKGRQRSDFHPDP